MPKTDKIFLTAEEALEIVKRNPDGGAHTFINPRAGILIGADHTKEELEAEIKDAKVREIGGESCRSLSHQLYLDLGEHQYFVATDDEKVDKLLEKEKPCLKSKSKKSNPRPRCPSRSQGRS